jgi:hypothetical protein
MTAPDDITPEELVAIEARCEAATPGPWSVEVYDKGTTFYGIGPVRADKVWMGGGYEPSYEQAVLDVEMPDAAFIAAARSDIPKLLAAIKSRDAELAELRAFYREREKACAERADERDAAKALLARAAELIRDMLVWGTNIDCTTESRKVLAEIEGADHGKP